MRGAIWIVSLAISVLDPWQIGGSLQVIQQHYTHLTKDDAYDAMIWVLTARRT